MRTAEIPRINPFRIRLLYIRGNERGSDRSISLACVTHTVGKLYLKGRFIIVIVHVTMLIQKLFKNDCKQKSKAEFNRIRLLI